MKTTQDSGSHATAAARHSAASPPRCRNGHAGRGLAACLAAGLLAVIGCGDHGHGGHGGPAPDYYPTSVEGLPAAVPNGVLEPRDGDTVILTAAPVKKVLGGREVRMLAYNGSIPGPLIKVRQGARITLRLRNRLGVPTTLHPHGVRVENRFDGAPDLQREIADADSFDYTLDFPDPGPYWYHPHVREAYALEMGLYGGILVAPRDSGYWPPANRDTVLLLDDVLTDAAGIVPFRKDMADHAMMGRFGNVFLANGDTALTLAVRRQEVIRLFLANACNTRVLNLGVYVRDTAGGWAARGLMRASGSDMGRYERFHRNPTELLSPGERLAVEIPVYDTATLYLNHVVAKAGLQASDYPMITLATFKVLPEAAVPSYLDEFNVQVVSPHAVASLDSFRADFARPPDKRLLLTVAMSHAGHLMKRAHDPAGKGVEWEDEPTMGMDNSASTTENVRWIIRDLDAGTENHAIDWTFVRGSRPMIRIHNDSTSMHPMPHPIHFHGQRFLVVRSDGKPNETLAWKDTYLLGRGETADILLDASNPGRWMAHCHIAEHLESMMMFKYTVE